MDVFAKDLYAPIKALLRTLDGKTVADMPLLIQQRMLAAGFSPNRTVLNIPMSDIVECIDEEAKLGMPKNPLRMARSIISKSERVGYTTLSQVKLFGGEVSMASVSIEDAQKR